MKEALSQAGIKFAYVDVTSGMTPLKQFLKYRDSHPAFESVREVGRVGLSCVVVDGERVYFDLPEDLSTL